MADTPKPPPGLRVSEDENRECDVCKHDDRGKCVMYDHLPVDDEWVCDSFTKGSQSDDDEDDDTPREKQPKTLRGARDEVRRRTDKARDAA